MTNCWVALVLSTGAVSAPLSVSTTVIVAEPLASAASVYVSVPLALMAGGVLKSEAPEVTFTWKMSVWLDSLLAPAEISVMKLGTVWRPASSLTAGGSAARVKGGWALIGLTLIVTVCAALALTLGAVEEALSLRTTVKVA